MKHSTPINAVLSLAGFGCTWVAAWNASRHQLSGANAGFQEWGIVVALLAVAGACAAVRIYNRFHSAVTSGLLPTVPSWLPTAVAERAGARDADGLRALAAEVDRLAKGAKP